MFPELQKAENLNRKRKRKRQKKVKRKLLPLKQKLRKLQKIHRKPNTQHLTPNKHPEETKEFLLRLWQKVWQKKKDLIWHKSQVPAIMGESSKKMLKTSNQVQPQFLHKIM